MNREEKKKLLGEYREKQRKEFEASLPMSRAQFQALFDDLNEQLEENECGHNFDRTIAFLKAQDGPVDAVLKWLGEHGAGCDCEVLCNVEEQFE